MYGQAHFLGRCWTPQGGVRTPCNPSVDPPLVLTLARFYLSSHDTERVRTCEQKWNRANLRAVTNSSGVERRLY